MNERNDTTLQNERAANLPMSLYKLQSSQTAFSQKPPDGKPVICMTEHN